MKRKIISLSLLFSIVLTNCSQRRYKSSFDCSAFPIGKAISVGDTLSESASYQDYVHFFAKHLNIPGISVGKINSAIRIWFWQNDTVSVLNLEKNGSAFFGHLLSFTKWTPSSKFAITITRCLTLNAPRQGWERLLDTLRNDDIALIPDGKPNYDLDYDMTRGGRIYIEYQKGFQYIFYSYLEPGYFQYVDSNAAKLHHLLIYLQDELSLNVYDDLTRFAKRPIRKGNTISKQEYRHMRENKFIGAVLNRFE